MRPELRIKEVAKQKGISLKVIAERIGIEPAAISQSISGNPTIERMQEIANILGVPITELFEQPGTDTISCPYCGGKIKVGKE